MTFRPISTLPALFDEVPDIEVRSSDGRVAMAWRDPDDGTWKNIEDAENPVPLGWALVEWREVKL